MTLDDFLNHIEAGGALNTPEIYRLMDEMSDEARLPALPARCPAPSR